MKLAFRILNVFGLPGQPLTGNPLCVFEDGRGVDDATMQALALQFNLSETTFILPSARATARMRVFTPAMELPFAGHPTLGTAHVVRSLAGCGDRVALETRAGVIAVAATGDHWTLTANAPVTRALDPASVDALVAALGLRRADLAAPPMWVDTGNAQLLVPLATRDAVRAIAVGPRLSTFGDASGKLSVYCFSPVTEAQMLVRYFFAKNAGSIAEDPATGSACANLGGYLLVTGATLPLERRLLQGEQVGRPSRLELGVDAARAIRVRGLVVALGSGTLEL